MLSLSVDIWRPVVSGGRAAPPIATNLAIWLRKGTAAGASWPDASGNARNLALTGSPTIGASTVTFSGTGQYGTVAFTIGAPMTVCMRVKQVSWTGWGYLCAGATTATNHMRQAGVSPQIYQDSAVFDNAMGGVGGATIGAHTSIVASYETPGPALASVININGTELGQAAFTVSDAVAAGFTLAAADSIGTAPSNIEVTEVVVYSVALTAPQRAQMISYLGTL